MPNLNHHLISDVIRSRRTINQFAPEPVPTEIVLEGLELAIWAPNHKLTQPWRFYLLGQETSQRIVNLNADMVQESKGPEAAQKKRERWSTIPGWLVVTYQRSDDAIRDKEDYAAVCCAVQNLSLFLWDAGIGMKWTSGPVTRSDEIYEILNLDRKLEEIVGVMWYGYPTETPQMKRRPAAEFVTQLP